MSSASPSQGRGPGDGPRPAGDDAARRADGEPIPPEAGPIPPGPGVAPGAQSGGPQHPPGQPDAVPPGAWAPRYDSRNWALIAHLSALIAFVGVPSFVGPLVVWLVRREEDPFVGEHAREALNFNLSVLLYLLLLVGLTIATFGLGVIILLPVVLIGVPFWLVFTVIAAVKAGNGQPYRYPLTLRLVS